MASSSFARKQYELDCQHLHHYFSEHGASNSQKLVEIMLKRKCHEFKLIRQIYFALYGQDLLHVLSVAQRNNSFERVAYLRMNEPQERDAEIIRNLLFGGSLNLKVLIEIACTRPSSDLQGIKQSYRCRYNSDVEQHVSLKINGQILLAILKSCRTYGAKADMSMAICDAKILYEAVESGKTIDQKTILTLLGQRNTCQLKAILSSFKYLYGHEFSKLIKQSKCGQFGRELRIVIRCIQNPEKFFAKLLRMKTADIRELLIQIVITRSEIDVKIINKVFAAKTGSSIENLVKREFNSSRDKNNEIVSSLLVNLIRG